MPSKSPQQHRFMEAAAHNPEFAKKAGIPQNVAKEFVAADVKAATKKIQAAEVRTQTGLKCRLRLLLNGITVFTRTVGHGLLQPLVLLPDADASMPIA